MPKPPADGLHSRAVRPRSPLIMSMAILLIMGALGSADPAFGLLRIDFEQKFFVHPGKEVWDYCVVRHKDLYHIFYIAYDEATPGARCQALGHATSPDLIHWTILDPAVIAGPDWWDADNLWAPDVVWDDVRQRWTMLYTGVDALKVQRACAAHSTDLCAWTKEPSNPVFVPDSLTYYWSPTLAWSSFRDPFVYQENGLWHMLSTAGQRINGFPGQKLGIVHRASSTDLVNWTDQGALYKHTGSFAVSGHDMESTQYLKRGAYHHLFMTEQSVFGVSHMAALEAGAWQHSTRAIIDWGNAAEIDQFDPGIDIFSRYAVGQYPLTGHYFYVVRFDTLRFNNNGQQPFIYKPHPLDRDFAFRTGSATMGNPCWGDNPAMRGEPSSGLVGHGWFGSQEYFQGPLSGRGSPGTRLGDVATGEARSRPFTIAGDFIRLLVGGGYYPETCYVALVDAATDSILERETGHGAETMTWRRWNVRAHRGRTAYIRIYDYEQGPFGHINVDEIEEYFDPITGVAPPPGHAGWPALIDHGPRPNPSNPATTISYTLSRPGEVSLSIYDLRGRLLWHSGPAAQPAGTHSRRWLGIDGAGRPVASGAYHYQLSLDGRVMASGALAVVR